MTFLGYKRRDFLLKIDKILEIPGSVLQFKKHLVNNFYTVPTIVKSLCFRSLDF